MLAHGQGTDIAQAHLLIMTTTQETITGDPIISRMTKIACCHAVRALRSVVPNPVPVAALTQRKRESMKLTWNFPLDAQRTVDQKSGNRTLRQMRRAIKTKTVLKMGVCALTRLRHAPGRKLDGRQATRWPFLPDDKMGEVECR